jgi:hypothetical protein
MNEITRPDWSTGGGYERNVPATVEAVPDVRAAIEAGRGPTPAESAAILGTEPAPSVPAKWDGNRPDWAPKTPVVHYQDASKSDNAVTRPDWNRNASGQFVTAWESQMRSQWENEGGLAAVAQIVTAKESVMYSVAPSLEAKVTEHLDQAFLMKAVDHMRLGVSYGPTGFWDSVARFEDALSPSERDAWARFCKSLNADEQSALIFGLTK